MIYRVLWYAGLGSLLLLFILPQVKALFFNAGMRWEYIFLFSFLLSYSITPFFRFLALKLNIMDSPDWRKQHDRPTPLLGGVAVYIALTTSLILNGIFFSGMKALLYGATLIFLMGLADDIKPLPALLKLLLQGAVSSGVILWGDIQFTFFYSTSHAGYLNIPLTLLWLVGITNALNFFDGIDGLAASLAIISALFLGIIAFNTNQPALGWFAIALIGASSGFLPHNFRFGKSASLFLGDSGSTFLGFILAGLAILGRWSNTSQFVSLTAPILIFAVLIFDMTYVNLSRIKNNQAKNFIELLNCVNKDHLHHRLLFLGFARKEVVFIISTISVCFGVSALIIMNQRLIEALLGLFQALLILGLIVTLMLKGRERAPREGERRVLRRRRDDRITH